MKANWFKGIHTPEKAKKRWHELCRKHHTDAGGDATTMQEINTEYQSLVTAFAWKEEWEKDKKTTGQQRSLPRKTKKRSPKEHVVVTAQPEHSIDEKTNTEIDSLIDAGAEFGKLLLKKILRQRERNNSAIS